MNKIGIYLGTKNDPTENIEKLLKAWGKYLSKFKIDVYGSARLPQSCKDYYTKINTKPRPTSLPYLKILSAFFDSIEYVKKEKPDILIQIWKSPTHAPGVSLCGKLTSVPVITRFPGDSFNEFKNLTRAKKYGGFILNNLIGRIPLFFSNKTICLGPQGQSEVVKRGINKKNTVLIPPPTGEENRFSPPESKKTCKEKLNLPPDKKCLLFVGRLSDQKGMPFLEKVIEKITSYNDYIFLLIGKGPYEKAFRDRYPEENVRVEGYVPYSKIDKYYKASNIYISPSAYEGIPLTFIEALQTGIPVIARKAGDVEFITPNIVKTPEEMVEMIKNKQYENKWLNKKYFSKDYQKEKLTSLIEELTQ